MTQPRERSFRGTQVVEYQGREYRVAGMRMTKGMAGPRAIETWWERLVSLTLLPIEIPMAVNNIIHMTEVEQQHYLTLTPDEARTLRFIRFSGPERPLATGAKFYT